MSEKKIRMILCSFCIVLTLGLGVFVWIMMNVSQNTESSTLLHSLLLVGGVTVIAQAIYAFKAQILDLGGTLAKREILFSIIFFQCIMQFGFGFSLYAVNQTTLQNESYDSSYAYFIALQQAAPENTVAAYAALHDKEQMPACVSAVWAVKDDNFSNPNQYFRFPVSDGTILMQKNQGYFNKHLREFAVDLLMSLVISIFLMIELVYMAAKALENRISKERVVVRPTDYLRQFAFLFYFAGFLSSSFVPLLARDLYGHAPNANFIAGLPYSVESAANCVAILLVTPFFQKKGWKPPYMLGTGIFMLGILMSALAKDIQTFICARAVVGIGYGICWMTLRNITTLSGDQTENFSSLTSGIFAGIMSGAAFGAALADAVGYKNVLLISAAFTLAVILFPLMIKNEKGSFAAVHGERINISIRDAAALCVFLLVVVIPTCVSEAFCDYVSPLYINELGLPTAYIGRVSLVYNLCIVYIGSILAMKIVTKWLASGLTRNIAHMALISLAFLVSAFLSGFPAMLVASIVLGIGDGFGFSVQNAYVLNTRIGRKLGKARMITYFSLFKKFGAMLGPIVFSFFLDGGKNGLGLMGVMYGICALTCIPVMTALATACDTTRKATETRQD